MQIGERYYDPGDNVIFKVMGTTYLSDPDIYISRTNKYPNATHNDWHC